MKNIITNAHTKLHFYIVKYTTFISFASDLEHPYFWRLVVDME